jgi:hypothetical protein
MLQQLLFSLVMSPVAAEDECRSFGTFITNKFRNYLLHPTDKVLHEKSNIIFAGDQGHFDVSYPVTTPMPSSKVSSPAFLTLLLVQRA